MKTPVIAHEVGLLEAMKYRPIGVHATSADSAVARRTSLGDSVQTAPMSTIAMPTLIARMIHTECSTLWPANRWWKW